jgi:hypothetical protein
MAATKSELKALVRRMSRLVEHIKSVSLALLNARAGELHVAVVVSGRIASMLVGSFDFGAVESRVLYEVHPNLIRLARTDKKRLVQLKDVLLSVFQDMCKHVELKIQGLTKDPELA